VRIFCVLRLRCVVFWRATDDGDDCGWRRCGTDHFRLLPEGDAGTDARGDVGAYCGHACGVVSIEYEG